ncbi:uncharacterized protein LOC141594846 [Silene latifolia]|uniref:uncharacterized protein LOC141594846 n=1 Tax=Silene latifolia TaxID=37657 RepID=UPI003D777060
MGSLGNHVYMKGANWQDYAAPSDCSWSWKNIIQIKDKFKTAYSGDLWLNCTKPYTVAAGYLWLMPPAPKVSWRHVCWNSINIPKMSFIYWASKHQRLLTRDRIIRMGFGQDASCFLCDNAPEDHNHLFFHCAFSQRCMRALQLRLRTTFPPQMFEQWYKSGQGKSKLQHNFVSVCFVNLVYEIWHSRNIARIHGKVLHPEFIISQTIVNVKHRWSRRNRSVLKRSDQVWMDRLDSS